MGAKKNQKAESGEQKKADGGKKEGGGGGDNASVVLKADLHCEGCVSKIVKTIRGCDGVEDVKVELGANKVTVKGKVDPAVVKEKVEAKTHKQVVVVSPQPANKGGEKAKEGGGEKQQQKKKKEDKKGGDSKEEESKKGEDDKKKAKEKEPAVTTAVFKMNLHCEGCIQKIYKIVSKTKGYHEMKLDRQKEVVTVTGAMDMKALAENLKKHLKRDVEIVPPKKEGGGEKKEKGGGNEKGNDKGKGGGKKEAGGGGGGDGGEKNKEEAANKMQVQVGYPYQGPYPYMYGPGYVQDQMYYNYPHAPQMFSDENPNACSVM
ncbi:PREDICTED: heavy metal-associated isoprenylated plant protein 3-like [Ipomoea nil]|uniref:heavy metal-associated isoprenylated plant protein 3-like n=1 Tax=Ipomoea nil TaxID=35883 RepID=UPI00090105D9|nr:PREDICTED: heavy metal-associated isoprenylated plant protein 3-like [Ipomoea nil]